MSQAVSSPQPKNVGKSRAALAAWIGTTVEFYDFFIYGTAAALVFPKLFFPSLGPVAGSVASFASFGVAFIARPVGGIIFGYFGDRFGRKVTLITTLVIMGIATVMIGLIQPSWGSIAPIMLFVLRFIQGLAAGGEWASAALFVGEHAPSAQRARYTMAQPLGTGSGLLLSTVTFAVISASVSPEAFISWGWRIPFLASALLVIIGLAIRVGITETPVYLAEREAQLSTPIKKKSPIVETFRHQWRQVFLTAGITVMYLSFLYMSVTYMTGYGTNVIGFSTTEMLTVTIIAIIATMSGTVIGGFVSDRIGRRPVILGTALVAFAWAFALYPLASTGSLFLMGLAMSVSMFLVGLACIAVTVYLPETFPTRYRSTAVGVSFNLGSIIGGAIPPIIAAPLLATGGITALGIMLAVAAGITVISMLALKETRGIDLHGATEPAAVSSMAAPADHPESLRVQH